MTVPLALALGVDLGGTKIEAVVVRLDPCTEIARLRVPTLRDEGYEAVLARTAETVRAVARQAAVDLEEVSIGVGMPGSVRRKGGLVKNSNTTCLNGRPFRKDLQDLVGRAIVFENDANCFALAEAALGAGRPYAHGVVFGVILGTGVGGGVIVRGEVWEGAQRIAGEWGHHAVWAGRPDARLCYCGQRGCMEMYASGKAIETDYASRSGHSLSSREIAARREEDPHARGAMDSFLDALGRGLANVIDILDPSAVILGGGVSNLEWLPAEAALRVASYVFNDELVTPILKNELGDSAGVIGAALRGAAHAAAVPERPA
jgi:fructokinase